MSVTLSLCWVPLLIGLDSSTCWRSVPTPPALSAGSAFARGLEDRDAWLDATLYCNALEPLLRLTGRDRDQCCDLTGQDDEPEVRCSHHSRSGLSPDLTDPHPHAISHPYPASML